MKVTLTSGMQFHYNDRLCEVISWNSRIVLTLDVLSKTEIRIPEIEVLEGIENGSIKLINEETVGNERLQSKSKDLNSYDKSEKERAEYRHKFIKGLEEEGVFSISPKTQVIIDSIAENNNLKSPSWRSVSRWRKEYIKNGRSIRGLIGHLDNCGSYERKRGKLQELIDEVIKEVYLTKERISLSETHR